MILVRSEASLILGVFYLVIAAVATLASWQATAQRQVEWHRWGWAMVSGLFLAFALMRIFEIEDLLRSELRRTLRFMNFYESRHGLQKPIVVIVYAIAVGLLGIIYFLIGNVRGRLDIASLAAIGCTGFMMILITVRIVSLHSIDELLYGPFKLNWLADVGFSLSVLASAICYVMAVRARSR